jgi:uncharacterized RDD family membrane protein YckC
MNWYYVSAGQQAGPVTEEQLKELARTGQIEAKTLVWREGMANWQPFEEALPAAVPAAVASISGGPVPAAAARAAEAATAEAVCAECGKIFPIEDTIQYGNARVCASCKPIFMQKLAEGVEINTGVKYGSFWVRFGAKFLDGLLLRVAGFPLGLMVGFLSGPRSQSSLLMVQAMLGGASLLIAMAYTTFFLGKYGATPGKMVSKLKVISADGSKVTYGKACGRFWAELLSGCPTLFIGYLIAAKDEEHRALHDRICNTRVVHKNS